MYKEIKTSRGGTLRVIGEKNNRYILCCSICSEDTELWPEGSITTLKTDYNNKNIVSCGCGNTNWKEFQAIIRIKRRLEEVENRSFVGLSEKYKGQSTKVRLYNTDTKEEWESSIKGIMKENFKFTGGKASIVQLRKINATRPYEEWLEGFCDNGFMNKGIFCIDTDKKGFWLFKCFTCSKDDLVKGGVCSGVFSARGSTLIRGHYPCRCSSKYSLTKGQKFFRIKEKLKEIQGSFISCNDDYSDTGKFTWKCKHGHTNTNSTYHSLVLRGSRCAECSLRGNKNGFNYKLEEDLDYLYIMEIEGVDYFKVGRSFCPSRRSKEIESDVCRYYGKSIAVTISYLFKGQHYKVYQVEQGIIKNFQEYYPCYSYGSSEVLLSSCKDLVLAYMKDTDLEPSPTIQATI